MNKNWLILIVVAIVIMLLLAVVLITPEEESKTPNKDPIAIVDSPKDGDVFAVEQKIVFNGTSSRDPDSDELQFIWSSNISGEIGANEAFERALGVGFHLITLTVTDNFGAENYTHFRIRVYPHPTVVISSDFEDRDYYSTEDIILIGTNSTSEYSAELNFTWHSDKDGLLGYEDTLACRLSIGEHVITLEVFDGLSTYEEEFSIEIHENKAPTALISSPIYNAIFQKGLKIYFDGSNSSDPEDHDLTYSWTSNLDGIIGSVPSFYAQLSAGAHIISLSLNDSYGRSAEASTVITVNSPPTALAGSDLQVDVKEKIKFDGSKSTDPDSDKLSYTWDFGDGNSKVGQIIEYSYGLEGVYIVTLTVDDGKGGIDNDTLEITVIHVFEGTGIFGHIYDNNTNELMIGVEVELWDWEANKDYSTKSDASGYYEFHTGQGDLWLDVYDVEGYYSYSTTVNVKKNSGTKLDIYLDKIPPETAKVFGYVYDDETKLPLEFADVDIQNERGYYNYSYTDEDGYYEMKAPPGDFEIYCYAWSEDVEYDYYFQEITLSKNQQLRFDIYLQRYRPDEYNYTYEFTSWDAISAKEVTTMYSSAKYIREALDQNEDGQITESEVTMFENMYETFIEAEYTGFSTFDLLLVDDIDYVYISGSAELEIEGAVGETSSTEPIDLIVSINLKSNRTIPISDTHNIELNVNYDTGYEKYIYYIKLPQLPLKYIMTNYTSSDSVNITNLSSINFIEIDPGLDPYPYDDDESEWVEIEAKR